MRIRRLELTAFGPFTDKVLEFPGEQPGLHVIYGPNEAGKSCTLRALKSWLYGFDERTRDNFVHANDQLRVAGLLENGEGNELYFARRKKRKADLLDAAGNPLEAGLLAAMLHGIDREAFDELFGLDHDTLLRGGTAILNEKGGAGPILLAAGTGIQSLQEVLKGLQEESDGIFKVRASKPLLNAALRTYAELKSEIGKASLSGREWKEHDQALRQALAGLEQERRKRSDLDRERQRLERIRQALQPFALRRELQEKLSSLPDVRPLASDFSQRRTESQDRLRFARQSFAAAEGRLQEFRRRAGEIHLNTGLLDQARTVAHLHQRLGEYRKGMKDRPLIEGKRVQEKTAAGQIWRKIRPELPLDEAEKQRPLLRRRRGIQDLAGERPLLEKNCQTATRERRKIQSEKEQLEASLQSLAATVDPKPLKTAVARAQRLGNPDADIVQRQQELALSRSAFDSELKRLGLWQGTPGKLLELPLPLSETVDRHQEAFRLLEEKHKAHCRRQEELKQQQQRLALEVAAIERSGEVPTESELEELRTLRDYGWKLLRRHWLDGEEVAAESRTYHFALPLHEAYEERVSQADRTADRLRREAERVHKYAHLTASREDTVTQLEMLAQENQQLALKLREQKDQWQKLWAPAGIRPLSGAEMSAWLSRLEKLRLAAERIIQEEEKIRSLGQQRQDAREAIVVQLTHLQHPSPATEELMPFLEFSEYLIDKIEENEAERRTLEKRLRILGGEIPRLQDEDRTAGEALGHWQKKWRERLRELGLAERSTPGEVLDFFDGLSDCLDHLDRGEDFAKRGAGIDRDAGQFTAEVHSLLQHVAPELASFPVDQAVEQLNGLVERARKDETTLQTYRQGIESAEEEIRQAKAGLDAANVALEELCVQAGCRRAEELEEAERCWQEQLRLKQRIAEEEERLAGIAAGQSILELEAETRNTDTDGLPSRLQELGEELEKINDSISDLDRRVGEERKVLEGMDGNSLAAQKAEEASECLAGIRRQAEAYTRLHIAARVLEEAMERYRAANQDPVLTLAGHYFRQLTLDSFDGLRTDMGDKGEQIIVGLRNGGDRIGVEAMSAGTRDQLFLALRLASLEHRLEKQEAVPFIVDDILINFDDNRSMATLKALGKLGEKNQVILFTHHRQVTEVVKDAGGHLLKL